MPELPVASSGADEVPTIILEEPEHFANFHATREYLRTIGAA